MMTPKDAFLKYQAQTSLHPLGLEVSHAKGSYIYDRDNKAFLDFVAGVSACPLGHCHPAVVEAVQKQAETYMHVMVYGEFIQGPALQLCQRLAGCLPPPLQTTYLVNSGTEAIEGAIKLAKRATQRSALVAANKAYHGNSQGSLSLMGFEPRKQPFRPLLPDIRFIDFNSEDDFKHITSRTAAVILETIQGSAGFILPDPSYLKNLHDHCKEVGALLILDEIQPGFGRTGKLFAFEHYGVVPDILVVGKGMAGGMPVGAFIASPELMSLLSHSPKMGHITTFGGHPVIAAAALATLDTLLSGGLIADTLRKEALFRRLLVHPLIKDIRGKGLMLSLMFETADIADQLILRSLDQGLLLFWLLFEGRAVRISPPLTVSDEEIEAGCAIILNTLNRL